MKKSRQIPTKPAFVYWIASILLAKCAGWKPALQYYSRGLRPQLSHLS